MKIQMPISNLDIDKGRTNIMKNESRSKVQGFCLIGFVMLLMVIVFSPAQAQIPRTLSYQGVVTDTSGNPKPDGIQTFTFRLYENEEGGKPIWTEEKYVQLRKGLFSTLLGDLAAFDSRVSFDRPYWLSIQVKGEPELSPRIPLTSVAYSLSSLIAEESQHADSARIASMIPDNIVTSEKIADGAVTPEKLSTSDAEAGQVLTFDGMMAKWQTPAFSNAPPPLPFWRTDGNSGTNPATDFLGTTDNAALVFKVNNEKAGRIDPNGPVFLGYQAGNVNTAANNTGIGYQALKANTTSDYNTAFGALALNYNSIGTYNTANGALALNYNTNGAYNAALGAFALKLNTTGWQNTATGTFTLVYNTNGSHNTANGASALFYNTTGNYNTANGAGALFFNTTGTGNTANGSESLQGNSIGNNNTALGNGADVTANNLTNATAIGYKAKVSASNSLVLGGTGADAVNVGIGVTSPAEKLDVAGTAQVTGFKMPTGAANNYVLTSNASGLGTWQATSSDWNLTGNAGTSAVTNFLGTTDNVPLAFKVNNQKAGTIDPSGPVFIGYLAGNLNTGTENTGMGYEALHSNTTGNWNTGIGYMALHSNTTGNLNIASGNGALLSNTMGSANTANGTFALQYNTLGSFNSGIGHAALRYNTVGSYNTGNGYQALYSNTGGGYNTASGYFALQSNTTGSYNTANGYQALRTNTTGNNNTALGNGADVTANNLTNATAIGYKAKVSASNSLVLGGTGADAVNVGIGVTSPAEKLDVAGTAQVTGFKMPTGAANNYVLTSNASGLGTWQQAALTAPGGANGSVQFNNTGAFDGDATNFFWDRTNKRLGVGTSSPTNKVDINGDLRIRMVSPSDDSLILTRDVSGVVHYRTVNSLGAGTADPVDDWVRSNPDAVNGTELHTVAGIEPIFVDPGQRLQSGTAGGARMLGDQGNTPSKPAIGFFSSNGIDDGGGGNGIFRPLANEMAFATSSTERMRITSGGTVGIGTSSPTNQLDIDGDLRIRTVNPADDSLVLTKDVNGVVHYRDLTSLVGSGWDLFGNAGTVAGANFVGTTDPQDLVFKTNSTEKMRLTASGMVGLGTSSPNANLEIQGNNTDELRLSNVQNARYVVMRSAVQDINTYGVAGNSALSLNNLSAENVLISTGGGKLGVGETSPTNKVDINGDLRIRTVNSADDSLILTKDVNGVVHYRDVNSLIGSGWDLSGNAGTTPIANFVGTTDFQDLIFRTNSSSTGGNTERIRLTAGGKINLVGGSWSNSPILARGGSITVNEAQSGHYPGGTVVLQGGGGSDYYSGPNGGAKITIKGWDYYGSSDIDLNLGTGIGGLGNTMSYLHVNNVNGNPLLTVVDNGNVGIGSASPGTSSLLELSSTTKGFVLPRMTKIQRNAIVSPVEGMAIYQTDNTPGLRVYNGTNWMRFTETAD